MSKGNAANGFKPQVFICYASDDRDLLANFVRKFKEFNYELDTDFYDQVPTHPSEDKTMHDRFVRFADECHLALILGSAALAMPDSYASKYELPILKKRRTNGEVILVGIKLRDFDVEEWNKDGIIDFAQIFISDMPGSRASHKNKDAVNNQLAVYNQIDDNDQDTYHKHLKKWINSLINKSRKINRLKNNINQKPDNENLKKRKRLRSEVFTNIILNKMIQEKFLSAIEGKLSSSYKFWQDAGIDPPDDKESYTWFFCAWHARWYKEFVEEIKNMPISDFDTQKKIIAQRIIKKNNLILEVTDGIDDKKFHEYLTKVARQFNSLKTALIKTRSRKTELTQFRAELTNLLIPISMKLDEWSDKAFTLTNEDLH